MKKLAVIAPFLILGILMAPPGPEPARGEATGQEGFWYRSETPPNARELAEEGPVSGPVADNELRIAGLSGGEDRTSLEMPQRFWSKLWLRPSKAGRMILYCRYPTGTVDRLAAGTAKPGRRFAGWFHAEIWGDYELWFTVDDLKSNPVRIQVRPRETEREGRAALGSPSKARPWSRPAAEVGFSTGGAKDINNFRENIERGYLPLPSDITYEGLFYDYYFDTGADKPCPKLFCPSYSCALSRDPFSQAAEHFLSVGLNSGIADFERKQLNLVLVLDFSGSMGSPFDRYYYDRFGNKTEIGPEESGRTKMELADRAVVVLLDHLKPGDRFGLVIFDHDAFVCDPLTLMSDKDPRRLREFILGIKPEGGTNMEAGLRKGTALFDRCLDADRSVSENRIIFLTDAMPNVGETGARGLLGMLETNARQGLFTTFIGIGVDFNTELVEKVTKIRGANSFSVHSAGEFKTRMDDEFDFMVTPLVFDLVLALDAPGFAIEKVYGSPEADLTTGEIMRVNTLFPSRAEEGRVKGGMVLLKLKETQPGGVAKAGGPPDAPVRLKVRYRDRNGAEDNGEAVVEIPKRTPDHYGDGGIRKAILLARYASLLKDWLIDERKAARSGQPVVPVVTLAGGIVIPVELGEWERQSLPLRVAEPYRQLFGVFATYFDQERAAIGDESLQKEEKVLEILKNLRK